MNRRIATTLTEVLIAIFIMGIGLMAILALFPLGAVQMAQAIKDDRAAHAAANAASLARLIWKQACEMDEADPQTNSFRENITNPPQKYPRSIQRFVYALDDPNFNDLSGSLPNSLSYPPGSPAIPPGGHALPPGGPGSGAAYLAHMPPMPLAGPAANQSSYPVYVDMIGWQANQVDPNRQWWVGEATPQGPHGRIGMIPRRPLYIPHYQPGSLPRGVPTWQVLGTSAPVPHWTWNTSARILKQFSLTDDLSFTADGRVADAFGNPAATSGGRIERQGRYSWAYLFRRPRNANPLQGGTRYEVDVHVIVYSGRSIDVPTDEKTYQAKVAGARTVQLIYRRASDKPAIRRGQWLLDATIFDEFGLVFPQGRFYRAVNIDEGLPVLGDPTISVELQTPLVPGPTDRIFVVMSNVVEVFQIGYVSNTTPPRNILDDQEY
jgi:type II secretory pathway pseudopilin PulG